MRRWEREWQPVHVVLIQSRCFFSTFTSASGLPANQQKASFLWHPKNCSGSAFDPILSITHQESYLCPSFWGKADGKEREGCWCKIKKCFWKYGRGVGYISWMGWEVWVVLKRTVSAVEREEHARTGKGLRKGKGKILVTLLFLKCPSGPGPLPPFLLTVFPCNWLHAPSPTQLNLSSLLTSSCIFCHLFPHVMPSTLKSITLFLFQNSNVL